MPRKQQSDKDARRRRISTPPGTDAAQPDIELEPFPGLTGEGAEATSKPSNDQGLASDIGDGTIGGVGKQLRERLHGGSEQTVPEDDTRGGTGSSHAGTNIDIAGATPHGQDPYIAGSLSGGIGGPPVGGMGTGTGRGRGSDIAGGVAGSGDSAGTGGLTGGTGGQGLPRKSDLIGTGGGVAVSGGRGSDLGTEESGLGGEQGGMSGGTMGGSRESDLGGGLSGGMRSGTGTHVAGGVGGGGERPEDSTGNQSRNRKSRKPTQD